MLDISIVLVNYKNVKLTENCIRSIMESESKLLFEIIVIDNHSGDGSVEYLKEKYPGIFVQDSGKNGGFAFGNNVGVKNAKGKYLLLLNNDTEVKKQMLDRLYSFAEKHPSVGILGCKALDRNGKELPVTHQYETLNRIRLQSYVKPILEKMGLQRKLIMKVEHTNGTADDFIEAQWIAGSALFIKKELYEQIGGLDENFFMYMEDEDLCRRVCAEEYQVGIIPYVGYVHYCGGSTIQSYDLTKEYIKSRLIFFKRYEDDRFLKIKNALYRQIRVVNRDISHQDADKMKKELDKFITTELDGRANMIKGIAK